MRNIKKVSKILRAHKLIKQAQECKWKCKSNNSLRTTEKNMHELPRDMMEVIKILRARRMIRLLPERYDLNRLFFLLAGDLHVSSMFYCRYPHPPSVPTKTTLKEALLKYTQHGRYHARRYLSMTISDGYVCVYTRIYIYIYYVYIYVYIQYIFNSGSSFCFLKSTPRTQETINRSVVGYLFATSWFDCSSFHSIVFNVQFMQMLLKLGVRWLFSQNYASEVSILLLPASYLC